MPQLTQGAVAEISKTIQEYRMNTLKEPFVEAVDMPQLSPASSLPMAVAVLHTRLVKGEVLFYKVAAGMRVVAEFTELPAGEHGFHIHRAGDLRGEGCKLACDHFHMGAPSIHGGPPTMRGPRHTGDLGNVATGPGGSTYTYTLKGVTSEDLWGRSVIVHADPDDYGKGGEEDSEKTGHSGKRIACAVIGRAEGCE